MEESLLTDSSLLILLHSLSVNLDIFKCFLLSSFDIDEAIVFLLEVSMVRPYSQTSQDNLWLWVSILSANIDRT